MAEEYLDEMILKARKEKKKEKLNRYIRQQYATVDELFQKISIGNVAEIKIPVNLFPMPESVIDKKYQFDPQPQIVMTNRKGDVNFTFSELEVSVSEKDMPSCIEGCIEGLRGYMPSLVFYEKGQEYIQDLMVCWFTYMSNSLDGRKIYNFMLYAATEKTIVMTMNCRYEQHEKWDAIARVCMQSLTGKVCNG